MKMIKLHNEVWPERISLCLFLTMIFMCITACSKSAADEPEISSGFVSGGGVDLYTLYQLSGDYSENVAVMFDNVVLGRNGERRIEGGIVGIPDNREEGQSGVHKLDEGYYFGGANSPYDVFLTLKYSDYKTMDDLDKADRPGNYGYAVIPDARVTKSYSIEQSEFWRIAEEMYPEDKEKYGPYWTNLFMTGDVFDKTMNRLIAEGLPGFELVYDETTYDPETDPYNY